MDLTRGRPESTAGRPEKEIRCYDYLDSLLIPYWRVEHPHADTMEDCAAVDTVLGAKICKNLLLCNRQRTDFYLLMLDGEKQFRTSVLSKKIGSSRLSFAQGEDMERLLDITPGSLSVLGLMNDHDHRVKLLIDADILTREVFGCHPCVNTASLRLRTADLMERLLPALGYTPMVVSLEP